MALDTQAWITPAENPIQPCAKRFEPVRNDNFVKPKGGLWTSTWLGEAKVSGWAEWCRIEGFHPGPYRTWLLTPKADLRLAVVDSLNDLKALLRTYALPTPMESEFLVWLDFERMAQDYDGMRLTDTGQWATRLTQPSLYGWGCESTCWFTWAFDQVLPGPKITVTKRTWGEGDDDED